MVYSKYFFINLAIVLVLAALAPYCVQKKSVDPPLIQLYYTVDPELHVGARKGTTVVTLRSTNIVNPVYTLTGEDKNILKIEGSKVVLKQDLAANKKRMNFTVSLLKKENPALKEESVIEKNVDIILNADPLAVEEALKLLKVIVQNAYKNINILLGVQNKIDQPLIDGNFTPAVFNDNRNPLSFQSTLPKR